MGLVELIMEVKNTCDMFWEQQTTKEVKAQEKRHIPEEPGRFTGQGLLKEKFARLKPQQGGEGSGERHMGLLKGQGGNCQELG